MKRTAILILLALLAVLHCGKPTNPYKDPDNAHISFSLTNAPVECFALGDTALFSFEFQIANLLDSLRVEIGNWDTTFTEFSTRDVDLVLRHVMTNAGSQTITCFATANRVLVIDTTFTVEVCGTPVGIAGNADTLVTWLTGTDQILWVSVNGSHPLSFQWLKDGRSIAGATSDSLKFAMVALSDSGTYRCAVSNPWGVDTSTGMVRAVSESNIAPQWVWDTIVLQGYENALLDVNLLDSCTGANQDPLSFVCLSTTLLGDSLYPDGRYTYSATYTDSGRYVVVATVSDGVAADTAVLIVKIANVNRKPAFLDSLPQLVYQIDETDLLVIPYETEDDDGDDVSVFVKETNLPRKDEVVLSDSNVTWQATPNDNNAYYLHLGATDGQDTTVARIDIGVGFVNLPPRINIDSVTEGETLNAKEGDTLRFTVKSLDPNLGDVAVLLSADNMPFTDAANGTGDYDTVTGEFWYAPSYDVSSKTADTTFAGLTFYAVDSADPPLADTFAISIKVANTNRPPTISLGEPYNAASAVAKNQAFSWTGSDLDGDSLTYTLSLGTASDQLEQVYQGSVTSFTDSARFSYGQQYYWSVAVSDGETSVASVTRSFTVTKEPATITSHPIDLKVVVPNTAFFQVTATGEAPLTYQWQKDGTDIVGSNSAVYQTGATSGRDHGAVFRCIVRNGYSNPDTSVAAVLSLAFEVQVESALHATISPTIDTVDYGANSGTFSVSSATDWALVGTFVDDTLFAADSAFSFRAVTAPIGFDVKCGKWDVVGSNISGGEVYQAQMEVYNGQPVVAYRDITNGNVLGVKVYDTVQATWTMLGSPETYTSGGVEAMSFAVDDVPYAAFVDVAYSGKVTVIKYGGGAWTSVGSRGFSVSTAGQVDICVYNGTPYVAYVKGGFGDARTLVVTKYDGAGWVYINEAEISTKYANNPNIEISGGFPYVAFQDWANDGKITVKRNAGGGSWVQYGTPNVPDSIMGTEGIPIDMVFGDNVPYIVYSGSAGRGVIQYSGGVWEHLSDSKFTNPGSYPSLDFNASTLFVSYKDPLYEWKATVRRWNGSEWHYLGERGFTPEQAYDSTIRIIGGTPYLSYRSMALNVMKYIEE